MQRAVAESPMMARDAPPPQLRSEAFRAEREGAWWRLETIVDTVETRSVKGLDTEDLLALPVLYRQALSSLSVARETSLDANLVAYLENLCQRAYLIIYGAREPLWRWLADFFRGGWSRAVRAVWLETLIAALLFLAGAVAGFLLVGADDSWFFAFVDPQLAGGRDPGASAESLRATLYDGGKGNSLSVFATFLFTNNARVAILAFALGFALGLPTVLLIITNACMFGAFLALFAGQELGFELGGWLAIHGTTEIFAIILSGAAGLSCARAIVFPGERSRLDAAAQAGSRAALVMIGVVLMMLAAAFLEGFGRQLIVSDGLRYAVGAAMLLAWFAYFYAYRKRPR